MITECSFGCDPATKQRNIPPGRDGSATALIFPLKISDPQGNNGPFADVNACSFALKMLTLSRQYVVIWYRYKLFFSAYLKFHFGTENNCDNQAQTTDKTGKTKGFYVYSEWTDINIETSIEKTYYRKIICFVINPCK